MNNIYVAPGVPVTIVNGNITIKMEKREEKKMKKNEGYVCPKCGEWDVSTEDYEMDCDCLWVKLYCPHCGETWSEYYTLTYDGYCHGGVVYDGEGKECTDI